MAIPTHEPTFLLTVRCKFGHVTAFESEDESRGNIDHETYGSSYYPSTRTVIEWGCKHEGCAEHPFNDRWNRITL